MAWPGRTDPSAGSTDHPAGARGDASGGYGDPAAVCANPQRGARADAANLRVEPVPLEGLHRDIYLALRDRYAGELAVSMNDRAEFSRMGTIVMYLLEADQILTCWRRCSSDADPPIFRHPPLPVEPGSRLWDLIQRYNQYETPAKFQHLRASSAVTPRPDVKR